MRGTKSERRPGVWKLRVYVGNHPDGTPIQITKTIDTTGGNPNAKPGSGSRLADRELALMVSKVTTGRLSGGTTPIEQLLERWLAHLESLGRSPTTLREYRAIAARSVVPVIGQVSVSRLTASQLDKLYASLTARGLSATSVRRVHSLIGAALHQAQRWDMVEKNVSLMATPPPVRPIPVQAPSPDEVMALLAQADKIDPSLARMLLIAAVTGVRRGELCALRWPDIEWQTATLTVARSVYGKAGGGWGEKQTKTHQVRHIGLDPLAINTLRLQREWVDEIAAQLTLKPFPDGFVWSPSPQCRQPWMPNTLTHFTRRAAKKAGVDTHLHALRHFSATQGIASGADVVTVAGRLGHRDPGVTLRVYSHVLEQRDRELAAAVGSTLHTPSLPPATPE